MKRHIKIFTGSKISALEESANEFAATQVGVEIVSANIAFVDNMGSAALVVVYEKTAKNVKKTKEEPAHLAQG